MSNLSPSLVLVAAVFAATAGAGCGNSAPATSTAAAVSGPVDMHCDMNDMEIKQSIGICMVVDSGTASALSTTDGGDSDAIPVDGAVDATTEAGAMDGGVADGDASNGVVGADASDGGVPDGAAADGGGDAAPASDFGATMYNSSGSDDDCKYDVKWTSTAVKENVGVTFDVNAIRRIDDKPATGADVQLEVYLNDHHPTPSLDIPNHESAGGNYSVGPVIFDAPGRWTVRFHFYEMCSDDPEDSPHGHAAFYVDVP